MAKTPTNTKNDNSPEGMLSAQRDDRERVVRESTERMESSTPTPTQEENDRARLGILDIDDKQDDGSGPDPRNQPLQMPVPQANRTGNPDPNVPGAGQSSGDAGKPASSGTANRQTTTR